MHNMAMARMSHFATIKVIKLCRNSLKFMQCHSESIKLNCIVIQQVKINQYIYVYVHV